MASKNVVLLVEHRQRDLNGCALIAHHLKHLGVQAHLEPVNAWQAVLGAHQPDMIVFNHTNRKHLADYTRHLAEMGVLTAVLLNEGLLYTEPVREYNSQRLPNLHLDYYFCWNELHRECLLASGYKDKTDVVTVGVPRFDFYFEPWKRIFNSSSSPAKSRPRILLCTNFGYAEWRERPKEKVDRFFSQWTHMPAYADYWNAIEINHRSRLRFLDFLRAILDSGKFEAVLKIHPRESRGVYENWLNSLPAKLSTDLTFVASDSNITPLILNCDLEISCEKCTTAMESWIARKPTIELIFEKYPLFFDAKLSALNVACDSPEKIVATIEAQLANPDQTSFTEGRRAHLAKWCNSPNGEAAKTVAEKIAGALSRRSRKKQLKLGFHDYRRAAKLKFYRALGEPYTFPPISKLKQSLLGRSARFSKKLLIYEKSITAQEVNDTLARIEMARRAG